MNILLFDTPDNKLALKPFSDTKPIAKIRVGITTIEEKWKNYIPGIYSFITADYLAPKFPAISEKNNLCINGSILPNSHLVSAISKLQPNEMLMHEDTIIAFWGGQIQSLYLHPEDFSKIRATTTPIFFTENFIKLKNKWDIFLYNEQAIIEDFHPYKTKVTLNTLQDIHTILYNPAEIFIEKGAIIKSAILNAEEGPIYIGKNAIIEEGAIIKGPVAINEHAQIKAGSRICKGTTIGVYSKVGGEVINSIISDYSNKAHEGFLGHSVIGEWCNLGAHTTTSNLRNDYSYVTVWDDTQENYVKTDLQFCGLFMGDYSKCGINSMFNAGTVVGVSTNLFGTGYFKKFIPSFTKGSPRDNLFAYDIEEAFLSIAGSMGRRNKKLMKADKDLLIYLSEEALPIWVKSVI